MFNYVTLIGLLLFAVLIVVVFTKKMYFSVAYAVFPIIACFLLGYNVQETISMFSDNVVRTMGGLLLTIAFAMIFFRTLIATGFFDLIAYYVVRLTKGKSLLVYLGSFALALIGGLSGSVSSCYFLVFGAFLAVYKKLNLDLKKLLFIGAMGVATTGAVPWHPTLLQSAGILGVEPMDLFQHSVPLMLVLLAGGICFCIYFALQDKNLEVDANAIADLVHPRDAQDKPMYRLRLFWINGILFVVTFAAAIAARSLPVWVVFFTASFAALAVNYPRDKECRAIFAEVGPVFFQLLAVFIPINLFVGVITNTGIIKNFVDIAMAITPDFLASNLHIVLLIISVPLCQVIPYQFLLSITPFVAGMIGAFGLPPVYVAMIVGCPLWLATSGSPIVATTYLGTSLAETEMSEFRKFAFPKFFTMSLALALIGIVFGVFS